MCRIVKTMSTSKESDLYAIDYPISEHQFENWSQIKKYAVALWGLILLI